MWSDYEAGYRDSLQDPTFLAWRELGARRKAENILRVCKGMRPASVVEIGCGTGAVIRALHEMEFAENSYCVDWSPSAVAYARDSCECL
jgi:methylase of polypeptide subunit release factors